MNRVNPLYHHSSAKLLCELEWIQAAKEDPKQFLPLYQKYHQQILRYVQQRMDDKDLAYDITSQVFLKAMKNLARFEFRGVPFGSWLYRIAKSELNQAYRDRKSLKTTELQDHSVAVFMEVFKEEENELNKKRLLDALSKMKEKDIKLIEMRFFEELSYKMIGEQFNITENNAKVKTFRALEKLKNLFHATNWRNKEF